MKNKLTGSEAIYGFCAWLSTRDKMVKFSSKTECSPIPPLIDEFCKVNKLKAPRKTWTKHLTHPK